MDNGDRNICGVCNRRFQSIFEMENHHKLHACITPLHNVCQRHSAQGIARLLPTTNNKPKTTFTKADILQKPITMIYQSKSDHSLLSILQNSLLENEDAQPAPTERIHLFQMFSKEEQARQYEIPIKVQQFRVRGKSQRKSLWPRRNGNQQKQIVYELTQKAGGEKLNFCTRKELNIALQRQVISEFRRKGGKPPSNRQLEDCMIELGQILAVSDQLDIQAVVAHKLGVR